MKLKNFTGARRLTGAMPENAANPAQDSIGEPWVTGLVDTAAGNVPLVAAKLSLRDLAGTWKARWSIGRMGYTVLPGLYGVGTPGRNSPVLVTANYKMTFDRLRKELSGLDTWILVLDTKGINVWCAAGKGTFGTREVIKRVITSRLSKVVDHRRIILPQLGAPGVKAHVVTRETGFQVVYGPVQASDLPAFLAAGQTASPKMRLVRFNAWDRLVLTPVELVSTLKPAAIAFGILFILNSIGLGQYGLIDLAAIAGAILAGCVLTPVLLPLLPSRLFAVKGAFMGFLVALAVNLAGGWPTPDTAVWLKSVGYFMALPAVAAFEAMNFTGCTTYTSPSGVNREMRLTLMPQLVLAATGILLLLAGDIVRLKL